MLEAPISENMMYRDLFSTDVMRDIWSDVSVIVAWLTVEKALTESQAKMDIIPPEVSKDLNTVSSESINIHRLIKSMSLVGRPIVGFVEQLREQVNSENAGFIHYRTTTQDIMDTASVLQMKKGVSHIFDLLRDIINQIKYLAEQHADTAMIGRTNGQYAKPITFGLKLKIWLSELERRYQSIEDAARRGFEVQFGGPVGNLDGYDEKTGLQLRKKLADLLELNCTELSWQNTRDNLSNILLSLAQLCTSIEKIAHNINLLSSSDIGELFEIPVKGKGASSSMRHKQNQRGSEFAEALGGLARGRASQILESSKHEHERSGGAWISEWVLVPEVFQLTAGALKWTKNFFEVLQVDKIRMKANLETAQKQVKHCLS